MARSLLVKRIRPHLKQREWLAYPVWMLEAALVGAFWLLSALLPVTTASRLGARAAGALGPRLYKNRHVTANLALAFPDWTAERRDAVAREVWANAGAVLAEYPHLGTLMASPGGRDGSIEVEVDPAVRRLIEEGTPLMILAGHLANWEIIAGVLVRLGVPLTVVYSPQSNPLVNRLVQRFRRALGCSFLRKDEAVRSLLRELRKGRSVGLLPDQRVDSGKTLPLLGRAAPSTTAPARVAAKVGCPVIPGRVERLGDAAFRVSLMAPIGSDLDDGDLDADAITEAFHALLEAWISERPGQWLCIKRRFAKDVEWRGQMALGAGAGGREA